MLFRVASLQIYRIFTGFSSAEIFILNGGSLRLFHTSDRLQQTIHVGRNVSQQYDVEPVG